MYTYLDFPFQDVAIMLLAIRVNEIEKKITLKDSI